MGVSYNYMTDEQTNKTDTQGEEVNNATAPTAPMSLYDKTQAIVERQEAANKKTEELLARQETLHANERLAGTGGGNVAPVVPEKLSDVDYANKFMKGEENPMKDDGISIN